MEKRIDRFNKLMYATLAVSGLYLSVFQNAIPNISTEFTLNSVGMGMLISLHFLGSFIFPFIFGQISDRIGETVVTITSFVLLITGLFLISLSKTVILFGVGILLTGGAFAVIEGTLSGLIARNNPKNENKTMNLSQMYFCLGAALGPLLLKASNMLTANWRAPYSVIVFLYVLCAIAFKMLSVEPAVVSAPRQREIKIGKLFNNKVFLALLFTMLLYVGVEEGVVFWVGDLINQRATDLESISWFISIYWTGMLLGRLIYSRVNKNQVNLLLCGVVLSSFFTLVTVIFDNIALLISSYFFIGFGFAPVWPFLIVETAQRFPKMRNTAIGAMMSAAAVGGSGMPALIGLIIQRFDGKFGFAFMLAAILTVTTLLFSLFRRKPREE